MRVQTSVGTYFIDWRHDLTAGDCKAITTCFIKNDKAEVIATNQAFCSVKDNFCREKGRKISLARVVYDYFNKPIRKEIWEAYLNRKVKDAEI